MLGDDEQAAVAILDPAIKQTQTEKEKKNGGLVL